jgi:hypothetical protein
VRTGVVVHVATDISEFAELTDVTVQPAQEPFEAAVIRPLLSTVMLVLV